MSESRELVKDVADLLAAIPAENGLETGKFVARLNGYREVFEQTLKAILDITKKIGESQSQTKSSKAGHPAQQKPTRPGFQRTAALAHECRKTA